MLVELTAGYCETRAAELGWSVRLGPQPGLASRRLELAPFRAELRLLGASHQILVWLADGGPGFADGGPGFADGGPGFADGGPGFAEVPGFIDAPTVVAEPAHFEPLFIETVACLPQYTAPLPQTAEVELPGWRYTIESDVRTCSAQEFGLRVAEIERCATHGLVGRYPGMPGALTAVVIRPWRAGLWWSTWHTYPQDRQIATTLSLLHLE